VVPLQELAPLPPDPRGRPQERHHHQVYNNFSFLISVKMTEMGKEAGNEFLASSAQVVGKGFIFGHLFLAL